ncbi:MAG: HAD-IB family phosphatase [bacterium]|nr:HAD-IB family phosphatase [bacterium]
MVKTKIVFFDMDGVLFDVGYFEKRKNLGASCWKVVAESIDALEEEDKIKDKWMNGELDSYLDWVRKTIDVHKKHGLTKDKFMQIIDSIPPMEGAKETIAELKKRGYLTVVVSGGFKELARRAKTELGVDFVIAACELIFDEKGKVHDFIFFPCDFHGKVKFFEAMVAGLDIKPEEAAMVGDGVNDIPIAKECGFSVAFNARDELKEHCDVIIEGKDLRKILEHFPETKD